MFALCLVKETQEKPVIVRASDILIDRLADFEKCDVERALATIRLLCQIPTGCLQGRADFAAVGEGQTKSIKSSDGVCSGSTTVTMLGIRVKPEGGGCNGCVDTTTVVGVERVHEESEKEDPTIAKAFDFFSSFFNYLERSV